MNTSSVTPCPAEPSSALTLTLAPLRPFLEDPHLTELCINRPGEAFIERATGWTRAELPFADFPWCQRFARLLANFSHQRLDAELPLLSATLPTGERAQVVLPPATTDGTVSITLRKPATRTYTLDELSAQGALAGTRLRSTTEETCDGGLRELLKQGDTLNFLKAVVRARKNILISGATGSGKTTWTKALIREIPLEERLITIEDARELDLSLHPNHVRLYYSKDGQGQARAMPKQLLEASLRMKPDRILLAELRGEEAFHYLRNVNSGHPGSITSIHAGSCDGALEQLTLLVKESPAGREVSRSDIRTLLHTTLDVVMQVGANQRRRSVLEIAETRQRPSGGTAA